MYRCPTCVSILMDPAVRRCPVCGENFKRRRPGVIGAEKRCTDKITSWDIKATSEASRLYAQETGIRTESDIDLRSEHLRDSSGRTAAADRR
jgi:hypothetical protein